MVSVSNQLFSYFSQSQINLLHGSHIGYQIGTKWANFINESYVVVCKKIFNDMQSYLMKVWLVTYKNCLFLHKNDKLSRYHEFWKKVHWWFFSKYVCWPCSFLNGHYIVILSYICDEWLQVFWSLFLKTY